MFAPARALAQGAIGGIVRDTSGAVLPGVTVEAASDAFIDKVFNATPFTRVNTTYGPNWQRPQAMLTGRFLKLGVQFDL